MRLFAVFLLLLALPACSLLNDDAGAERPEARVVEIRTTQSTYQVEPDLLIQLEVVNASAARVYYDICGEVYLEELEDGAVSRSWNLRYLRCYAVNALNPGEPQAIGFDYHGLVDFAVGARFDPTVRYRFRFSPFSRDVSFTPGGTLGAENQLSNAFAAVR